MLLQGNIVLKFNRLSCILNLAKLFSFWGKTWQNHWDIRVRSNCTCVQFVYTSSFHFPSLLVCLKNCVSLVTFFLNLPKQYMPVGYGAVIYAAITSYNVGYKCKTILAHNITTLVPGARPVISLVWKLFCDQ